MDTEDSLEPKGYREIGELLTNARNDARISLEQASRALHIRVRYLEAMEGGLLKELPGLPYVRGYIQTYAGYLALDREEVLRRFDAVENAMREENVYFPQALGKEKKPTPKIIWGGLAAAFACYAVWYMASTNQSRHISTVDHFPENSEKYTISANIADIVPCIAEKPALYPPCVFAISEPEDYHVPPLNKRLITILEMDIMHLLDAKEYARKYGPKPEKKSDPVHLMVEKEVNHIKEEAFENAVKKRSAKRDSDDDGAIRYQYPSRSDF